MIRAAIFAAMMAGPAFAESEIRIGGSIITMAPHDGPAVARVRVYNSPTNRMTDAGQYPIEIDGLTVYVEFERNVDGSSDRFTFIPEDGFFAIPDTIILPETHTGKTLIYPAMM